MDPEVLVNAQQLAALGALGEQFASMQDSRLAPYQHSERVFPISIFEAIFNHRHFDFIGAVGLMRQANHSTWHVIGDNDIHPHPSSRTQRAPKTESCQRFLSHPINRRYRFYPSLDLITGLSLRTRQVVLDLDNNVDPKFRSLFLQYWVSTLVAGDDLCFSTAAPTEASMQALEITHVLGMANRFLRFAQQHLPHLHINPAACFGYPLNKDAGTCDGAYHLEIRSLGSDLMYKLYLLVSTLHKIVAAAQVSAYGYFELVLDHDTFRIPHVPNFDQYDINMLVQVRAWTFTG